MDTYTMMLPVMARQYYVYRSDAFYASYLYDEDIDTAAYRSDVWNSKAKYHFGGDGESFDHSLSYFLVVASGFQTFTMVKTTDYHGHRVTLRADATRSIEGKSRRCINNGGYVS